MQNQNDEQKTEKLEQIDVMDSAKKVLRQLPLTGLTPTQFYYGLAFLFITNRLSGNYCPNLLAQIEQKSEEILNYGTRKQ